MLYVLWKPWKHSFFSVTPFPSMSFQKWLDAKHLQKIIYDFAKIQFCQMTSPSSHHFYHYFSNPIHSFVKTWLYSSNNTQKQNWYCIGKKCNNKTLDCCITLKLHWTHHQLCICSVRPPAHMQSGKNKKIILFRATRAPCANKPHVRALKLARGRLLHAR